jgi:hypothetical protein
VLCAVGCGVGGGVGWGVGWCVVCGVVGVVWCSGQLADWSTATCFMAI